MTDREKVKIGLQCIIDGTVRCESCGYAIDKHGNPSCQQNCASDALSMLKEQDDMISITTVAKLLADCATPQPIAERWEKVMVWEQILLDLKGR